MPVQKSLNVGVALMQTPDVLQVSLSQEHQALGVDSGMFLLVKLRLVASLVDIVNNALG